MIRRLLNGLAALLLLGLGLVGLPAFLLGAYRALDAQMPDLVDLPSVLLSPGDGGLFLLLVLAIGWVCWAVFTAAFAVEVIARARGIRTPHLGAFFPQATMAQAVSSVALMLTLTPVAAHALPVTPAPAAAPTTTTSQAATAPTASADQERRASEQAQQEAEETHGDYVVERGDTLWDIADEQLDDPTRYPEIVAASEEITQPDGRQLTDPDLILPGWTLHVPSRADPGRGARGRGRPRGCPGPLRSPIRVRSSTDHPDALPLPGAAGRLDATAVDLPSTAAPPAAHPPGGGPGPGSRSRRGPADPDPADHPDERRPATSRSTRHPAPCTGRPCTTTRAGSPPPTACSACRTGSPPR